MPIYEFKCERKCGVFEQLFRSIAEYIRKRDHGIIRCPHCFKNRVKRVTSKTAPPQFKGTGFYTTDYK